MIVCLLSVKFRKELHSALAMDTMASIRKHFMGGLLLLRYHSAERMTCLLSAVQLHGYFS